MSGDFGEYLAHLAGEGFDLDAPVPHLGRRDAFRRREQIDDAAESMADEYSTELPTHENNEN